MDSKALFNISYGVFLLGTKNGEKINACITNTCMQVAQDPVRIAITAINSNLTCQMIKNSGIFSISVLDKSCDFELIKRFGYQSGRNVDKFAGFEYKIDKNGCPYIEKASCSLLSCKVVSMQDLGTHTLFIAKVEDAIILGKNEPLTYSFYQNNVKPKQDVSSGKKIIGWRCKICGYEYYFDKENSESKIEGEKLPKDFVCPICGHPAEDFEPIYEK